MLCWFRSLVWLPSLQAVSVLSQSHLGKRDACITVWEEESLSITPRQRLSSHFTGGEIKAYGVTRLEHFPRASHGTKHNVLSYPQPSPHPKVGVIFVICALQMIKLKLREKMGLVQSHPVYNLDSGPGPLMPHFLSLPIRTMSRETWCALRHHDIDQGFMPRPH